MLLLPYLALAQDGSFPELPLKPVPRFLNLPVGVSFGEVSGVAQNSKGHIFVFNRGPHPLLEFDAKGNFVKYIAQGLIQTAHGIRIDAQDNIWLTDVASHLVLKLNHQGNIEMVLGKNNTAGEWDNSRQMALFNKPSDVCIGSNGDIFVTDGYGNSRIVKFSKDGKFLKAWGTKGTGESQFNIPHAIVADAKGLLYVADRENKRIQLFDQQGKFITMWTHVGSPYGLFLTKNQEIFMSDGVADRIVKLDLTGKILGTYGSPGKAAGQFGLPHSLTVTTSGAILVAEVVNWRVQQLIKK